MTEVVEVESLTKYFGAQTVFRGITFSLKECECLLVEGANGAGKTTLLRCVAGLLEADEGRVALFGRDLRKPAGFTFARRSYGIGYMPQQSLLYAALTIEENIELVAGLRGRPREQTMRLLDRLGLGPFRKKRIAHCSQGTVRRAAYARTLLSSSKLLILDEPFSNLDADGVSVGLSLLDEAVANGACVLIASHQNQVIQHLSGRSLKLQSIVHHVPVFSRSAAS